MDKTATFFSQCDMYKSPMLFPNVQKAFLQYLTSTPTIEMIFKIIVASITINESSNFGGTIYNIVDKAPSSNSNQ